MHQLSCTCTFIQPEHKPEFLCPKPSFSIQFIMLILSGLFDLLFKDSSVPHYHCYHGFARRDMTAWFCYGALH